MIGDSFNANRESGKTLILKIEDEDGAISITKHHHDAVCWPQLLEDFITLLTAAGYVGVKERIALNDQGFLGGWDGQTFSDYGMNDDDWK